LPIPTIAPTTSVVTIPSPTPTRGSGGNNPKPISTIIATTTSGGTTSATATPTEKPDASNQGLVIGGAAVGGLVFMIGLGLLAFRCTLNRRERDRRKKEMAATLAENFSGNTGGGPGGDPIGTPRKGYMELGDGNSAHGSGGRGANLTHEGSQDAYYAGGHKEGGGSVVGGAGGGGGQEYYNPHYVQERYGAAHVGNYGMYEETELSVIGGGSAAGRTGSSPYHGGQDLSMGYPPGGGGANQYGGYNNNNTNNNNNNNNNNNGGYYGGGGGAAHY
ncbi:hypothetical protein BGZ65_011002, partial [Modicella reniformis]